MGKNVLLITILVFLIITNVTATSSPKVSPNPSPNSNEKQEKSKARNDEVEKKEENIESCDGIKIRCHDTKSIIACVKGSIDDASKASVLILNEGDNSLKVDLTVSNRKQKNLIDIPQHQSKKVNISLAKGEINEITLNAGYGDCLLHLGAPTSQGNYFQWVPSYSKFMTPIYGAYLVLLITIIAAGVSACCWFRNRKRQTDIPYQELEMSMPETAAPIGTTEAWDQNWDDDWDEERGVDSPDEQNISANGLAARTQNKDGWEDWAD